jgi:hypothetical protein
MEFLPLGLACSVLRGNGITHLLEMAHADFGVVLRRIWRGISRITVFGEEIAVGNAGFVDGSGCEDGREQVEELLSLEEEPPNTRNTRKGLKKDRTLNPVKRNRDFADSASED